MNRRVSLPALIASSLLGVVAVATLVAAAFVLFGAWAIGSGAAEGFVDEIGTAGAALVGALLVGFAILAGIAARETFLDRPQGIVLGLITAIATVLAASAALLEASSVQSDLLLYLAIALGAATLVAVSVDAIHQFHGADARA